MIAAALFYYQTHIWRNRLIMRIRRLRQPKYLFGAVVGGLYFYWYFVRGLSRGMAPARSHGQLGLSIGSLMLFVMVLLAWILPHARAALSFTEAEVAFLFPAPVSRRTLIQFKLLKSQTVILFSALFMTLIGRSWGGAGSPLIRMVGWWVVFANYNLHLIGSSFAVTQLMDRGMTTWRRRIIVLTLLAAFLIGTGLWVRQAIPKPPDLDAANGLSWLAPYVTKVLESGPLPYLLYPFRLVLRPYFAADTVTFLKALAPALLIMALQYLWVIRSDVAFEEASIDLSRRTAERLAAARAGNWQSARGGKKKARRAPFTLRPTGSPAVALLWKNLVSAGNMVTARVWMLVIWVTVFTAFMMRGTSTSGNGLTVIAFLALIFAGLSLFWGPQMLRNDLRQDLPQTDVLKMYPLPGWQIVAGEALAPAVILAGVQWILLVTAFCFFPGRFESQTYGLTERIGVALSAAIVLPCVDLIAVLIPNAAVLFFPAWFVLGKEAPRGFETTGQQLILMFGQLLILTLSLLPAGLIFALVLFVTSRFMPVGLSLLPGAIVAALILLAEAGVAVKLLGRAFEQFDVSDEVLQAG